MLHIQRGQRREVGSCLHDDVAQVPLPLLLCGDILGIGRLRAGREGARECRGDTSYEDDDKPSAAIATLFVDASHLLLRRLTCSGELPCNDTAYIQSTL